MLTRLSDQPARSRALKQPDRGDNGEERADANDEYPGFRQENGGRESATRKTAGGNERSNQTDAPAPTVDAADVVIPDGVIGTAELTTAPGDNTISGTVVITK